MNITTELERSFGDGPAHRPVEEQIAAGRRVLVRRRLAAGAVAAVAAVVIGAVAWAMTPGGDTSSAPDPATSATPSTQRAQQASWRKVLEGGQHAGYAPDGRVVLRPGWRIVRRVPNPLDRQPPARSVGLVVTDGKETYWYLLDVDSTSWDPAKKGFATYDEWLADQVALQTGEPVASPVEFRSGTAELVAVNDARIIQQRANPDVPGFAGPGDTTAVAEVVVDGERFFVLARRIAGSEPEYFASGAAIVTPQTLDAFLAHARRQYDSGEGLR